MSPRAYIPVLHGACGDRPDEADTLATAAAIRDALERLGHRSDIVHVGLDLGAVAALAAARPAVVFNLVEALDGDDGLAHLVPAVLEHLGQPYTGNRAEAWGLTLSKNAIKRTLRAGGLPTPAWSADGRGLDGTARVIVKSQTGHASLGIDSGSVVPGGRAAAEIAARQARFGGSFFAEAFVEGREFNLSVIDGANGPRVLPPAEIDFSAFPAGRPRIVDYEAKWQEGSFAFDNTPRRFDFAPADGPLLDRLAALSLAAWEAFGLGGYARVDFRVDAEGRPWILEANLNPCLAADAGFAAAAARAGLGFDAMIAAIVAAVPGRSREAA